MAVNPNNENPQPQELSEHTNLFNSTNDGKIIPSKNTSPDSGVDYETAIKETGKFIPSRSRSRSPDSGVDYEIAIKETGYGKFNYLLLLVTFPASFASTFEASSLSFALPMASCDFDLNSYDRGLLNAACYLGMISSAYLWGYLSDSLGRQRTLMYGFFGTVLFSVSSGLLSQGMWSLLFFRFLSGVMICGCFSIFVAYLSELCSIKHRDRMVMAVGLFQSFGCTFLPLLSWIIIPLDFEWELWEGKTITSWRVFIMVCSLPSLISGVGVYFCPESPRFLLAKGKHTEALTVLRSIYSFNTGKSGTTYSVEKLKAEMGTQDSRDQSTWQELTALFRPPHWQKALLAFSVQFGGLMTLHSIRLFLPQLFFYIQQTKSDDLDTCDILALNRTAANKTNCEHVDPDIYLNLLIVYFIPFVGFCVCTAVVKSMGKRNLLVGLFLLQAVAVGGLGWAKPTLTIVLSAIFVAFATNAAVGLLGFVVQVFPTRMRSMAVNLTLMFGRVGVCVGNMLLPFSLSFSCQGTFLLTAFITLFCAFVLYLLAVEAEKMKTSTENAAKSKTGT